MSIAITGVREVDAVLAEIPAAIARAVQRKAMRTIGKRALADAKAQAPVSRTIRGKHRGGALKRSFTLRALKRSRVRFGVRIVSKLKGERRYYGGFVEFGTRHVAARPFMRPAITSARGWAPREFAAACLDGLRDPKVRAKIAASQMKARQRHG